MTLKPVAADSIVKVFHGLSPDWPCWHQDGSGRLDGL